MCACLGPCIHDDGPKAATPEVVLREIDVIQIRKMLKSWTNSRGLNMTKLLAVFLYDTRNTIERLLVPGPVREMAMDK